MTHSKKQIILKCFHETKMSASITSESVVVNHNAGFFSCCSVKLHFIIEYMNHYKKFPKHVDSSNQFSLYKIDPHKDITFDYFQHYDNIHVTYDGDYHHIDYDWEAQHRDFSNLEIHKIHKIILKYFSLSTEIQHIVNDLRNKYTIDFENTCVLFYRGNDKGRETRLCGYEEYLGHANYVLEKNPSTRFLIQSDETQFIEFMEKTFPHNSFVMKDEIRHIHKCDNTVDIVMSAQNSVYSKYYLAITYLMSQCRDVICGSGNCSIWIIFYRGHLDNIFQYLNGRWIVTSR